MTGGAGFIGSRLVQALLREGCRVRVLDIQRGRLSGMIDPRLEFVGVGSDVLRGGMCDREIVSEAMKDVGIVYHLAINWNGASWKHELPQAELFDANVRGTLNLLEAARTQHVRHFLFSSSCAVYGHALSESMTEETACNPELWTGDPGPAYGIMKLITEKLCLMYFHQHNLPVTVFRIDVVFDDKESQMVGDKMVRDVVDGTPIQVVKGEGQASIHVNDIVDAFLLSTLDQRAYGQVFNLSSPSTFMTEEEAYQLLIRNLKSKSAVTVLKSEESSKPVIESIDKIRRILGWSPKSTKEDLERAIIGTVLSMASEKAH